MHQLLNMELIATGVMQRNNKGIDIGFQAVVHEKAPVATLIQSGVGLEVFGGEG
jgi:hypothetical protein